MTPRVLLMIRHEQRPLFPHKTKEHAQRCADWQPSFVIPLFSLECRLRCTAQLFRPLLTMPRQRKRYEEDKEQRRITHAHATSTNFQINLGKGKVATANLPKEAKTHKIDVILVQELYSKGGKILGIPKSRNRWLSENGKAGIISLPSANTPVFPGTKENAVAIKIHTSIGSLSIISGYSSPYSDIQDTIQDISQFITSLTQESVLIGADMNAHSTLWGYPNDSPRGNAMENFISSTNRHLLNVKDAGPTFPQRNAKGWPDLTLSIGQHLSNTTSWEVLEDVSFSDHNFIKIQLNIKMQSQSYTRFKTAYGGHNKFIPKLTPSSKKLTSVTQKKILTR
ncbi:hypothetical protein AVEN_273806-1 [Araneus ventricosus]|uniref:Endonuclease/exonuclease/phosphatase domain-containing protein n=1 Tax=Araneus ventricosus TaxID=182803 RepID=A0A4Y2F8V1_ARAVE|nr:hypothetical protein AVEN_273806-1 [Araneus ventricosus]